MPPTPDINVFAQYGALGTITAIFIFSTLRISEKFIDYLKDMNQKSREENERNMEVLKEHTKHSVDMNNVLKQVAESLKENALSTRRIEDKINNMEKR